MSNTKCYWVTIIFNLSMSQQSAQMCRRVLNLSINCICSTSPRLITGNALPSLLVFHFPKEHKHIEYLQKTNFTPLWMTLRGLARDFKEKKALYSLSLVCTLQVNKRKKIPKQRVYTFPHGMSRLLLPTVARFHPDQEVKLSQNSDIVLGLPSETGTYCNRCQSEN